MMITTLFAHLERKPKWNVGETILPGAEIGMMGNTGKSFGAHVHMGNARGVHKELWHLADYEKGEVEAVPRQLNYFIDWHFFKAPIKVTVPFADYKYQEEYGKLHSGYDLSTTKPWPWPFFWNRSMPGIVVCNSYDEGYGNFILITYDSKESKDEDY